MTPAPEVRLSGLQLAVLRVLWGCAEATVNEVHAALRSERKLAPTTVATLLRRLEKRGLLSHRNEGRQFVYRAMKSADEVGQTLVSELVDDLCEGRAAELFAHLLAAKDVAPGDLARIKDMIAEEEERTRASE